MSFDKYKDAAWMEPEDTVQRYEAEAWTDCDTAKRYKSEAWEEVWANTKLLDCEETMSTAMMFANAKWEDNIWMWAEDDGGYIYFFVDGEFTDPTISFVYEGGLQYYASDGTMRYAPACNMYIFAVTSSGVDSKYPTISVGSATGLAEPTSYSNTLTGTFSRVGIMVDFHNWNISPDGQGWQAWNTAYLSKILIDGQKYKADPNDAFDYTNT